MSASVHRVRLIFRKDGGARYLSHLDLMATLEYAFRRAHLPVERSEGFNPRPRIVMAAPLALGHVGEAEILDVSLTEPVPAQEVAGRIQAALPAGIVIQEAESLPEGEKAAATRLRSAVYRVDLAEPAEELDGRIADILARPSIEVVEQREGGSRRRDLRPFILGIDLLSPTALRFHVRLHGEGTVRPEQILDLLAIAHGGAGITRERIELAD